MSLNNRSQIQAKKEYHVRERKLLKKRLVIDLLESRNLLAVDLPPLLDINTTTINDKGSDPSNFFALGNTIYFGANNIVNGIELWKSDGTAAGTSMVKDIAPGGGYSYPQYMSNIGNNIYLDAVGKLWKSDGTAAGTVLVKDINPNGIAYIKYSLTINGTVYFSATNGTNGEELWKTDGTAAGTVMVKDINPGANSSDVRNFVNLNGTLYFVADNGVIGRELWKSDGTAAGTVLVKDIATGFSSSSPQEPTVFNGKLYFRCGLQLWTSDGTANGTYMIWEDVFNYSSYPGQFSVFNGTLYFGASSGLWKTDGTAAGTIMVKDVLPSNMVVVNGILYFNGYDSANGKELWKSDGTSAGTVLLKDIWPGVDSSDPEYLTNVNGALCFAAGDTVNGYGIWQSDGTSAGTVKMASFASKPQYLKAAGNNLFYSANTLTYGRELYVHSVPTVIGLSSSTVSENLPIGTTVGSLTTYSSGSGFTYSLVAGNGDVDNTAFQIVGNTLRTNSVFDYETRNSYSIRMRSTDNNGVWTEKVFVLEVTNVNEAPVVVSPIADMDIGENERSRVVDLSTVFANPENGPLTYSVHVYYQNNSPISAADIYGTNLNLSMYGNGHAVITVTATSSNGMQTSDQFNLVARNLRVRSFDDFQGVVGQERFISLDATNMAISTSSPYKYEVDSGDGFTFSFYTWDLAYAWYTYTTPGLKVMRARVTDPDGYVTPWKTITFNIATSELQGNTYAFGGTTGNDTFTVTPTATSPIANISLNSVTLGTVNVPTSGIKFFGGSGTDTIVMNGTSASETFRVNQDIVWRSGLAGWPEDLGLQGINTEKVRVNAQAGNDIINILDGNIEIDGGSGTDVVNGYPNYDYSWRITGSGSGTVNGGTFTGVESIVGGERNDSFAFIGSGSLSGSINGGGGTGIDTLDYSGRSAVVAVDLAKQTATGTKGISNFEVVIGAAAATDTLIAPATVNNWDIKQVGNSSLNNMLFRGFETLTGGSNTDTFNIGADVTTAPVLNGGSGTDTLSFANRSESITVNRQARSATLVPVFNTIERFIGGSGIDTLIGTDTATTWTINDPTSGTFTSGSYQGFENLTGGALNDTFKLLSDTFNGTITGGLGIDTLTGKSLENTWKLTGVASGSLNDTLLFNSVENLTGGTLADNFLFYPAGTDFGMINGGSGTDSLNYSLVSGPVTINLATLTASKMANFAAIESVVGTNASDTLYGTNAATAWKLSTASSGLAGKVNFSSFENLNAGTGVDTLTGDNTANQWLINGVGAGTLNGSTSFSGMDNFTGGTADDTYVIAPSGSIPGTLGGGTGTGVNTLSYAGWSTDVVVNAIAIGSATAINLLSANFHFFIGGSGNDRLTAFSALASVLIGNAGNDTLVGSGKRDILIGGLGTDNLQGGADEDILIGGATAHDTDLVGLKAIRAEWTSTRTQALRLSNLRGIATTGLNAGRYLNNGPGVDALIDDAVADSLFGGTSTDWFITGPQDTISDLVAGEPIDSAV